MHNPTFRLKWIPLLIILIMLQGCGFHLRGSANLPTSINPLIINGLRQFDDLRIELVQILTSNGIQVTEERKEANAMLNITGHKVKSRTLSVDRKGKVIEIEISESAQFDMIDPSKKTLVPTQHVTVTRSYVHTEDQMLGKQREQDIYRKEMRQELASRIVKLLEAQLR